MRVLVTGGAGFLGPHVGDYFRQQGQDVHLTDSRNDGVAGPMAIGDLTSLDDMLRVTEGINVVCHLGGVGDVYLAMKNPSLAALANVVGTATLLEACKQNKVGKVVYASSWEVYGKPHYQPLDEEHPCDPDHPYTITKLAGERLVMAYDEFKDLPGVSLRLGTSFGPGLRPNSVFSRFIRRAMAKEPIIIDGSGLQTRQFTYALDVARAFYLAAASEVRGEVLNIVAQEPTSIRQLAQLIAEELPTEVTFGEARPGDVPPANVTSAKAERLLNWKAETDFQQALHELIGWHMHQEDKKAASL